MEPASGHRRDVTGRIRGAPPLRRTTRCSNLCRMESLPSFLDSFLAYLQVERGFSPHTVAAYRQDLRSFLALLAEEDVRSPREIREAHVFQFLVSERQRGREVSSVRRSLSSLKSFFRFLVRGRILDENPATNIETPRTWKHLPDVLEVQEVERLLAVIDEQASRYPRRDRAILELAYATGLRVSEICHLRVSDLRRDLGILCCLGKGSRERVVPVSETCWSALSDYLEEERPRLARRRPTEFLFLTRSGNPLGREVVSAMIFKYARLAGLPGRITPHTLRHSMATHLIRGGADLRAVQEILGHVKLETTEIYTHIERSDLKHTHRKYHPRG